MIILGVNAQNHDASVSVINTVTGKILYAGHAERYSHVKNDADLNREMIIDALKYSGGRIDEIVWYENPFLKKLRYVRAGQWQKFFLEMMPKKYLEQFNLNKTVTVYSDHHLSHAAGGYFTSGFSDAAVVVVDAIGEMATTSVYYGQGSELKKIFRTNYPHSVGLFYSSVTQLVGLKPNEEEYILMGMAAYGNPYRYKERLLELFVKETEAHKFELKHNLHRGMSAFFEEDFNERDEFDLAAAAQSIVEDYMVSLCKWARQNTSSANLVLAGGVALNCVANTKIAEKCGFDNIWIMPNPGDAGSSLGAILALTKQQIKFDTPFLGYDINRAFDYEHCIDALVNGEIIGVANGRAEFGPRAFGNRSLLGDPRIENAQQRMNQIKRRQNFRPFAPVVLEEHAHEYFDMPVKTSPYMQFIAKVKNPYLLPGISHIDNSARVQTLTYNQNPTLHTILSGFFKKTGCPVLMNTSLNIKGKPLVNTWLDAQEFERKYRIKVF